MISTIVKRDGREVPFDINKIAGAIYKAAQATGGKDYTIAKSLAEQVVKYIDENLELTNPTVEQIQDIVEKILIENGYARTSKEYILYRAERSRSREMNTSLMKIYEDLTFKPAIDNDVKRENANINGDTAMGTMLKYGSEGAKKFNEMFIMAPHHSAAHSDGDIHIHDMDFLTLTTTCCQIDLDKLFEGGFSTGNGFLREPNDIRSYSALACIAIQSNQNDQHGGQSIPCFDYYMAKGVSKSYRKSYLQNLSNAIELLTNLENSMELIRSIDKNIKDTHNLTPVLDNGNDYEKHMKAELLTKLDKEPVIAALKFAVNKAGKETEKNTYQAMEAFVHNLNTMHSRAGAQIPFSSINYGTDTSPEGRMVIRNILLATESGLGNNETPIFPIHIFKVKEGVNYNENDPNYDLFKLACRVSAKRLFPNFSFLDAPYNKQFYREGDIKTEIAYMGCRTRVIANTYDKSRQQVTGRGNLSFTSVNLPRLALRNNGNLEMFFEDLDRKIDIVIKQLLDRFKIQSRKKVKNFPFLMGQGIWLGSENLGYEDTLEDALKHGTLTMGFIGLAETLVVLTGDHHGETVRAQNLGLEIVGHMRRRMDDASEKYNLNFSLIATPAEGLSGRFVGLDRKKFGEIKGVTDKEYYTNSFHIPVYYKINAFDKIRIEAPYHELTNGGHITYVELDGDPTDNIEAFEIIVRAMKEASIGYGSINHPVDRDPVCGYTGIIHDVCPECGRSEENDIPFERIRRITGYLVGTLDRFNNAKQAEVRDRIKHTIN